MSRRLLQWVEAGRLPDAAVRVLIRRLHAQRLREEASAHPDAARRLREFAAALAETPLAVATAEANVQHYEVPTEFFLEALGPRLKYSSALWPEGVDTLGAAEEAMLALTAERAQLADGQDVLELGCGWGSLTLWMAEHFPGSRITAVSNSRTQRAFIEARAREHGLANARVITADMNAFAPEGTFDRIVSVEMFEHMRNWPELLRRGRTWLRPAGRLFIHIFCHRARPYFFEVQGEDDWMARHFFTGGMMPADDLLPLCAGAAGLALEARWPVDGRHYGRTLRAWLDRMDARREAILPLMGRTYGAGAEALWFQRWRLFMMACEELFNYAGGREWYVAHYRLAPTEAKS